MKIYRTEPSLSIEPENDEVIGLIEEKFNKFQNR